MEKLMTKRELYIIARLLRSKISIPFGQRLSTAQIKRQRELVGIQNKIKMYLNVKVI
jgi:hypothetical protein